MPVLVLFYQSCGLSMTEILFLPVCFSVGVFVFELPSGFFADLYGRKRTMAVGFLLITLGIVLKSTTSTFVFFACWEFLLGVAVSLISGADSALLYDSLVALEKEDDYKRWEGRLQFTSNASEGVAAIFGGLLALISLRTPLFVEIGFMSCAFLISLTVFEPPRAKHDHAAGKWALIKDIVSRSLKTNTQLRWIMLYSAMHGTTTFVIVWFIQPFLKDQGLELGYFGIFWAFLNLSVGIWALGAHRIEEWLGKQRVLALLSIITIASYLMLAFLDNWWGFLPIVILYASRGIRTPLFKGYINELCSSEERATVLSLYALIFRITFLVIGPLIGFINDVVSFKWAMLFGAVVFSIGFVVFHLKTFAQDAS